jgi:hypothetical protein
MALVTIALGAFGILSASYSYVVTKRYLEILDKVDDVKDVIDMSIDVLNECHSSLDEKTKIEVFSDEPVIRDLVLDMARARDSVLKVSNVLDEINQSFNDEEWDHQDNEKKIDK